MINFRNNNRQITILGRSRTGKKLLVLDLDLTLCHYVRRGRRFNITSRPYLHFFLKEAYKIYDIIIWSATKRTALKNKLILLGMLTNDDYRLLAYLWSDAMDMVTISHSMFRVSIFLI